MDAFTTEGSGYLAIQNSRPQTIGYGLTDSPLLQLAWIAEKVHEWTELPVDRDQLLTTVSLYWFTRSGASAAHTLYEQAHSSDWGAPPAVPQGFAVFGADETVRRLVPAPPGSHWTEFPHAKHFPAMEDPPTWPPTSRPSSPPCRDRRASAVIPARDDLGQDGAEMLPVGRGQRRHQTAELRADLGVEGGRGPPAGVGQRRLQGPPVARHR